MKWNRISVKTRLVRLFDCLRDIGCGSNDEVYFSGCFVLWSFVVWFLRKWRSAGYEIFGIGFFCSFSK